VTTQVHSVFPAQQRESRDGVALLPILCPQAPPNSHRALFLTDHPSSAHLLAPTVGWAFS
jgi:hypothetical protein